MDQSNFIENFTIIDESGDSEDSDTYLDDDVTHVQRNPEHDTEIIEIESDFEEVMSIDESETSPEAVETTIHPYLHLIESFEYQKEQLEVCNVELQTLEETYYDIIRTQKKLMKMIVELRSQREISLTVPELTKIKLIVIVIGTMEKEFVIDATKLSSSLVALTEIFINPKIVKIVHGLERTIASLHNTYHLYLVNVFDVKPAYFLKERKEVVFFTLLQQQYGIWNETTLHSIILRKGAHYLLSLYHDLKNYLLLNDKQGYMALLEKMRKDSMSLKNIKVVAEDPIKKQLMQYHRCGLDVLEKVDDWRMAKFGEDSIESKLSGNDIVTIARALPLSVDSLHQLISVKLSLVHTNELLDIVRESRRTHYLPLNLPVKPSMRRNPAKKRFRRRQKNIKPNKKRRN